MYREHPWRQALPLERYLEISYESLTREPEETIRKMVNFLGLEWDENCLHPERNHRPVSTPSLWQVRQPLYQTSVSRWKRFEPWIPEFLALDEPPTQLEFGRAMPA
jgi:hypothetical protein